jgi:hypothetical protein
MAKYELLKQTDIDGIWYKIQKDGIHVNNSYTRSCEKAEEMLMKLVEGTLNSETNIETIKTIEIDEKN